MNIDIDTLKSGSTHRRKVQDKGWFCHHCKHTFAYENTLLNHRCKEKMRSEEIKTIIGQNAYQYYSTWMKQKKFKPPTIDTFISSQYYLSFINFSNFIIKVKIDKPELYIRMMVRRDLSPTMWCRNQTYSIYLEYCEKDVDPLELTNLNINFLKRKANTDNINIENIFNHLGFKLILEMIRLRHLSAWFLLNSDVFTSYLKTLDTADLEMICGILNINFWVEHFKDKEVIRKEINALAKKDRL